ncbi:MAG: acetate kinase [Acutalibacteraceae bacterium]|nr:acetate kinase [Acutalibacteraceae bacterium]
MKVLVINAGSSSLKFQLIDMNGEFVIAKGTCGRVGAEMGEFDIKTEKGKFEKEVAMPDHTAAFQVVKEALTSGETKVIDSLDEISAIGHRVVQGGSLFKESTLVTDEVIEGIKSLCDLAPLHNPAHIQGINACIDVFGKNVPEVVVFDNAFHSTMPEEAYMFGIPYEYYEKYKIRRYGFHGTSHRYVSAECAKIMGKDIKDLKIITCHLGNGSSITAVKGGKVIDTSMGLTPLDGFIMGTRSGNLDPSVVTFLQEKEGWTPAETNAILNKKSGVFGISGKYSDDRDILKAADEGNERAELAKKMLWYQIRKYIGQYIAAMQGVDAIVFTGGIGENSQPLRQNICESFGYIGVTFNAEENAKAIRGKGGELSGPDSKIKVYVIPTNEELMIARDTKEIAEKL